MKEILISIKPQWVEKILNGEKTIEIRKTKPSCDLPVKVYIYCTKSKKTGNEWTDGMTLGYDNYNRIRFCNYNDENQLMNGKVVAEFTLNKVDTIFICDPDILLNGQQKHWTWFKNKSCLDCEQLMSYIGYGNDHDGWGREWDKGYAWHIDNLKIYDKPKELGNFKHFKKYDWWDFGHHTNKPVRELESFVKPPQSWSYIEKVEEK